MRMKNLGFSISFFFLCACVFEKFLKLLLNGSKSNFSTVAKKLKKLCLLKNEEAEKRLIF